MPISKDMPIIKVLQLIPGARDVFAKHGMGCASCLGAANESIERGAKTHGVDLQQLLSDLEETGNYHSD